MERVEGRPRGKRSDGRGVFDRRAMRAGHGSAARGAPQALSHLSKSREDPPTDPIPPAVELKRDEPPDRLGVAMAPRFDRALQSAGGAQSRDRIVLNIKI